MKRWPDLRDLLQGLRWAVVGGVATRAYMPERQTLDLDLLIDASDAPELWARLKAAGWRWVADLSIGGQAWTTSDGIEVDMIAGHQPWLAEALASTTADRDGLPIIDLPYLVLLKLEASRTIDLGDLSRMLGLATDPQLQRVRELVARHRPEDVEDLEALVLLGRMEMGGSAG